MNYNFYVYLITNKITNKQYVGSRMAYKGEDIYNDSYMGSSKYLNEDYEILGIENFEKKIIQDDYANIKDMLKGESYYMHKYNTLTPNGYNRYDPMENPGFHMGGCHHSEETKEKMKKSHTGKIYSDKIKQKIKEYNLGRIMSEETKKKISESLKGKKQSEETIQKRILKNKGLKRSEETKEKIKNNHIGMIGKFHKEETKLKISSSLKNKYISV
jgi:group I intron endonuclease